VAAADGVDVVLADDLAEAARREPAAGVAARHLLDAATVAPEPERAERYLLEGAWLLLADGQQLRAAELRERAAACADGPLRDLVLGTLDRDAGRGQAAERALRRAADEGDPATATAALAGLGTLYVALERGAEAVHTAQRLLARPEPAPEVERGAWVVAALGEMFVHGAAAGLARLARRLPESPDRVAPDDAALLVTRGTLGFYAGRVTAAIADLHAGIPLARRAGTAQSLPRAHLQLAQLMMYAGEWDEALLHARLVLSLVDDERLVWIRAQAHAVLGRMHACRGAWTDAEEHVSAAEAAADALGTTEAVFNARNARGTLARARGRPEAVVAAFGPLLGGGRTLPMATSLIWWPQVVLATIDCGDLTSARVQVQRLRAAADERGTDLHAQLLGLDALIALAEGDLDAATDGLARATALAGPDVPVLDRADLHHRWGRLLVRRGRRRDGVAQLRRAAELLAGAEPFRRRVEADLAEAGMRAPQEGPHPDRGRSPLDLTERERDVVALVVRGMTNREAAGELYVSEKAVEYHLGNVYAKLGIRSRRDLRARLGT